MSGARTGVYPGSFDPITVAHLAIAEAARDHARLDRVVLTVSRDALGKGPARIPSLDDRLAVLHAVAAARTWLDVQVTDERLVADIAAGFDAVVVGADKWNQITDPLWYGGSIAARDTAVARLPRTLIAPRGGVTVAPPLPPHVELLTLDEVHAHVSATAARAGALELMLDEARAFDERTGAWSDPDRYRATRA